MAATRPSATARCKSAPPHAIPSGPGYGNVEVDGTLDLNGYSVTLNGLSGSGTVMSAASAASTFTVGDQTTEFDGLICTLIVGDNDQTSQFDGAIVDGSGVVGALENGLGTIDPLRRGRL